MLRNFKKNHQSGFTIIEVLIVLAIAGLIMVAVFTAVPALQRSSRNSQRKSSASQIMASISNYVSNNNGTLPVAANITTSPYSALTEYKPGFYTAGTNIWIGATGFIATSAAVGGNGSGTALTTENVIFVPGVVCDATNNSDTVTGASTRSYAILYAVETGGTTAQMQCLGS